ncbi:hypothetical protein E2562_027432 [Oryza meyeriana var. granulata]|uniref:Xylanase inhibitor N-terminal domain-containing protein n=1 Tax=Oryza meyeriana var. granulata TaxID=110450 RepID=A0A6G1EQB9_9ORYZ|nr:hypothetical protein E2562_027432 [Oryza meyeriana var. granulata]
MDWLLSTVQASSSAIQALEAPITKDTKTQLYTLSISNKNYLLDLSGQLLSSPCSPTHPTVACSSGECAAASGAHKYCSHGGRTCTVRPTNPVTGERAAGDLTLADIVANASNGKDASIGGHRPGRNIVMRAGQPPHVVPDRGGRRQRATATVG